MENQLPPNVVKIDSSIVVAICKVQAAVNSVSKSEENKHGGYKYASTDAVYGMLTRKLADAGLTILCMEDVAEVHLREVDIVDRDGVARGKKTQQWGRFVFSFVLATADATWSDPRSRRTVYTQITGPQTFMAAQSYAEKAYLRSLFKIPTGDQDLDAEPQADTEEDRAALAGPSTNTKRKSSYAAKKDGTTERFNAISKAITAAPTIVDLKKVYTSHAEEINAMPAKWLDVLRGDYEERLFTLRDGEPATEDAAA